MNAEELCTRTSSTVTRCCLGLLLCLSLTVQAWAGSTWSPAHTWVFAVGVLQFKSPDFEAFTPKDRRDEALVKLLQARGVPADHVVFLRDKQATLAGIRGALSAHLRKTGPDDTLIFYYDGHGYTASNDPKNYFFASYDSGDTAATSWPVASIVRDIEASFRGSQAILMADCCESGALAEAAVAQHGRVSYAVLTSSSSRESSTGNWTFTQALVDGFGGSSLPDLNGDGHIDVAELAQYAHDEMMVYEGQVSTFAVTGTFDRNTVISPAPSRPPGHYGDRVEVLYEGKWYTAKVMQARANRYQVRWMQIGFDTKGSDEWVPVNTVRRVQSHQYAVGSRVEVLWEDKWYKARVLRRDESAHYVHYDEYSDAWDEWVPSSSIRPGH